jgi:AraC-like DNA-binding protein
MTKSNDIYRSRVNNVIDYVNNNLDKSISLEELASVANFSPFHFHRIFVAVTGESVNNFSNRMRLEKAARLLKFSNNSISEIATECGLSSPSTFSRAFKQYFGITPNTYRNNGEIKNSKFLSTPYKHLQIGNSNLYLLDASKSKGINQKLKSANLRGICGFEIKTGSLSSLNKPLGKSPAIFYLQDINLFFVFTSD